MPNGLMPVRRSRKKPREEPQKSQPSDISRYFDEDNDEWGVSSEQNGYNAGYNTGGSVGWNTGSKNTSQNAEVEKLLPSRIPTRKKAFYNQNSLSPTSSKEMSQKRKIPDFEEDEWAESSELQEPLEKKVKVVLREISTQTEPPHRTEVQIQCNFDQKPITSEKHTQCCNIGKFIETDKMFFENSLFYRLSKKFIRNFPMII